MEYETPDLDFQIIELSSPWCFTQLLMTIYDLGNGKLEPNKYGKFI